MPIICKKQIFFFLLAKRRSFRKGMVLKEKEVCVRQTLLCNMEINSLHVCAALQVN